MCEKLKTLSIETHDPFDILWDKNNVERLHKRARGFLGLNTLERVNYSLEVMTFKYGFIMKFEKDRVEELVKKRGSFLSGSLEYLTTVRNTLGASSMPSDEQLLIEQIYTELCCTIYPNTSACYSLVPRELKSIKWKKLIDARRGEFESVCTPKKEPSTSKPKPGFGFDEHSLPCLTSLTLCNLMVRQNKTKLKESCIKASQWLVGLEKALVIHLSTSHTDKDTTAMKDYCRRLALDITQELVHEDLFQWAHTIEKVFAVDNQRDIKTFGYLRWTGVDLLSLPQSITLPMVVPPKSWANKNQSGYLLPEFTNIAYYGVLDSKSQVLHSHSLRLINTKTLDNIQSHAFSINKYMLQWLLDNSETLTNSESLYLSSRWITPTDTDVERIERQQSKLYSSATMVADAIAVDLNKRKQQTLIARQVIELAQFYSNRNLYWIATHDFRGRVYRLGFLNPQWDDLNRSLVAFCRRKPTIKRRKQSKSSLAQYNYLLSQVLANDKDLIESWDRVFCNKGIRNDKFDSLLVDAYINQRLKLHQVAQLLLIRNGEYDRVGVYYDATASAYQIAGLLHQNKDLSYWTNLISCEKSDAWEKQDLYSHVLEKINQSLWDSFSFKAVPLEMYHKKFLKENITRKLVKAIVMPTLYGKTAQGFAQDLQEFFAVGKLYPRQGKLYLTSHVIVSFVKEHTIVKQCLEFLDVMRSMSKVCKPGQAALIAPTWESMPLYNKVETLQFTIYVKEALKKRRRKVSINTVAFDKNNMPIRSQRKASDSFPANYTHLLDATVCSYVINNCNFELATVHDSFLIRPEYAYEVNNLYRKGLILVYAVHLYNIHRWLTIMLSDEKINDLDNLVSELKTLIEQTKAPTVCEIKQVMANQKSIIDRLKNVSPAKKEYRLLYKELISYIPSVCSNFEILQRLESEDIRSIFPDQ